VFAAFRDGGQRQFVDRAVPPSATENDLADVMAWARDNIDQPLDVSVLADYAHLSVTTLHRRFRDRIGTTPLAWLTSERVDLARRLIEETDLPLDAIAHRSGLGTAANLRKQLRRQVGMPPSHYRRQFSVTRPGTGAR
jgi:AraC family transcriptional regulator, transcriptional activator FtrA